MTVLNSLTLLRNGDSSIAQVVLYFPEPMEKLSGKGKGKATILAYIYTRFVFKATSLWGRVYETNTTNRTEILLRIPTGGRLTSWLFTKRGEVEFGTTKTNER